VEVRQSDPALATEWKKEGGFVRAVVFDRYGPPDVLRLEEVDKPVPKDDEVLVKVHATTVNRTDCGLRAGHPFLIRFFFGLHRPKVRILGSEMAGVIEAVGGAVRDFAVGDHVFGISTWRFGAYGEFMCMRETAPLAQMPAGIGFEEAAAVCDGPILALKCLRSGGVQKGKRILVYGASGSIGTAAVQLATYFGADVTGVCNTKNLELMRSLGAGRVIDYTQGDFTRNGETYDVILDAVGNLSFKRCKGSLKSGGLFLATDGFRNLVLALRTLRFGDKKVLLLIPPRDIKPDVVFMKELIEAGKYRPVIDRCYPLEDVIEATRYVETGQKTGNVVLTINGGKENR
jgi:NADPH:quinone reductase-like Zn-dependent oxidoreductase